jgi:predicted ATPase
MMRCMRGTTYDAPKPRHRNHPRPECEVSELRAVTSLSPLLQKRGKKDEAHQMLAEIYGWFTEGFDTADLKEAKALLKELS